MIQFTPLINNKKAFALSIVLWIVAALLVGVAALTVFSKDSVKLSKELNNKLQTQLKAEDILEGLIFYITTSDYNNNSLISQTILNFPYKFPNAIIVDNRWYNLDKNTKIRLQDTSSLINTITYSGERISAIATTNEQTQLRYIINDSIKDWIDKDDFVELNGAEGSSYELQKELSFKIRNSSAIQDPQEFRLINGIDTMNDILWNNLKDKLYYGRSTLVNLTLIDKRYLSYLLNISESYAQTLINIRKDDIGEYIKIISMLQKFDDEFMGFSLSHQFKIEIQVTLGNATSILKTIIDFKQTQNQQYTIIEYSIK